MKSSMNRSRIIVFATLTLLTALVCAASATAGAIGGPVSGYGHVVLARSGYFYNIAFYGRETARVSAQGNGDIDLYVYDAYGRLVAADTDADNCPTVSFCPDSAQTYRVVVQNSENYVVTYNIATN